jgi:hypothetical protein
MYGDLSGRLKRSKPSAAQTRLTLSIPSSCLYFHPHRIFSLLAPILHFYTSRSLRTTTTPVEMHFAYYLLPVLASANGESPAAAALLMCSRHHHPLPDIEYHLVSYLLPVQDDIELTGQVQKRYSCAQLDAVRSQHGHLPLPSAVVEQ